MKKTRFILVGGCLLVTVVLFLFALTMVLHKRESQDSAVQTSLAHQHHITSRNVRVSDSPDGHNNGTPKTRSDVRISDNPDRYSSDTPKTLNSRPTTPSSKPEPVASINPTSKTDSGQSEGLLRSDDRGNLPVSQNDRTIVPVETPDEAESDNADDADGLYAGNPEACGQDGKPLPFPEAVLARKAQDILQNYKNRKAKEVVIESEIETREDGSETELRRNSSQENTSPDSADAKTPAETVTDTVEILADQSLHEDEAVDHDLQVKQLLAALAEDNPPEVRLQAIYLLADVAPDLVEKFLDDKDDLIRCEAERIVGILPEQ